MNQFNPTLSWKSIIDAAIMASENGEPSEIMEYIKTNAKSKIAIESSQWKSNLFNSVNDEFIIVENLFKTFPTVYCSYGYDETIPQETIDLVLKTGEKLEILEDLLSFLK